MRWRFFIALLLSCFSGFSQPEKEAAYGEQKTIYLFSGLGADSTAFANLELPGFRKVFVSWIPQQPDESVTHYAGRIKSQITASDPYIIGLSFGGIIAVEVSKQIEVKKMALISSAKTRDDLSRFQCFFMRRGFSKLVPGALLRHTNFLTYSYFGVRTPKDKLALSNLLLHTDVSFFRWALKAIACWDNTKPPERTIQIHGTADRIIAHRLVEPDYSIKGGGHLMVFDKADTISKIIMNYFRQ